MKNVRTFSQYVNEMHDSALHLTDEEIEAMNEWGSSDTGYMLRSMHKDAGSPKKMPSPFDKRLRQAAEDAVDFYWNDWVEYQTTKGRDDLIDKAVRGYLQHYFKDQFALLVKMFEGECLNEAKYDSNKNADDIFFLWDASVDDGRKGIEHGNGSGGGKKYSNFDFDSDAKGYDDFVKKATALIKKNKWEFDWDGDNLHIYESLNEGKRYNSIDVFNYVLAHPLGTRVFKKLGISDDDRSEIIQMCVDVMNDVGDKGSSVMGGGLEINGEPFMRNYSQGNLGPEQLYSKVIDFLEKNYPRLKVVQKWGGMD